MKNSQKGRARLKKKNILVKNFDWLDIRQQKKYKQSFANFM